MESSRDSNCKLTPLEHKNIDTGLGLERMAQILQQVPNNYETDLILPILERAAQLAGLQYALADPSQQTALKVGFDVLCPATGSLTDACSCMQLVSFSCGSEQACFRCRQQSLIWHH